MGPDPSQKALHRPLDGLFSAIGFFALYFLNLPFPLVVLGAAVIGGALPQLFTTLTDAPRVTPVHRLDPLRHFGQVGLWAALWLLPLLAVSGWGAPMLASIGWFFAKLAVVTFGGAYAVLSYMTQTVVQDHGWITSGQMVDALGLAETTPGPLILVTQFVAMLTGHQASGAGFAIAAGGVTLWATFVPCFLWIFAAAPYVEQLSAIPRLNAALKAITATVVGVILNLSILFAVSILFDQVTRVDLGILTFNQPVWTSLNIVSLILVVLAPLVSRGVRGNLFLLLAIMAGLALTLNQILLAG